MGTFSLISVITDVSQKVDSSENQTSITAMKERAEIDALAANGQVDKVSKTNSSCECTTNEEIIPKHICLVVDRLLIN